MFKQLISKKKRQLKKQAKKAIYEAIGFKPIKIKKPKPLIKKKRKPSLKRTIKKLF
ncbi:hypothetical protein [Lysinibacillus mangiferihumi]|uniref:hypothetical protein n=1 Tax=Lysinibacillus mangiferihumi TaxID=1130819 RepID=UPI00142DCF5F|nr:hypothetical protein [Lysinibacillus mangiferihumi]